MRDLALTTSQWWRASGYVIESGVIRPAPGSEMETYDPWEDYCSGLEAGWEDQGRNGRAQDVVPAPYHDLLALARDLPDEPATLTPKLADRIIAWCGVHGLLGVLLHETISVAYPARYEWIAEGDEESEIPDERMIPVQVLHTKGPGLWHREYRKLTAIVNEHSQQTSAPHDLVPSDAQYYQPPLLVRRPLEGDALLHEANLDRWTRHAPTVGAWPPLPGSAAFQGTYAESVCDFVRGAKFLLRVARALAVDGDGTRHANALMWDRPSIESLLADVTPSYSLTETGEVNVKWLSSSLLGSFAMMMLQNSMGRRRLHKCSNPDCGLPFASVQARYCSEGCASTHRQQRYRDRKKARTLSETGLPASEVADRITREKRSGGVVTEEQVLEWTSHM